MTALPGNEAIGLEATADEYFADEIGREEAVLHHAGRGGEPCGELAGLSIGAR